LFAGATGIGCAPLLVRWSEVGPSATAFYRVLFALPVLWVWVRWDAANARDKGNQPALPFSLLAGAGAFFTADLALWHWSLQYTTVANSTLLTNLAPIFVTLGAFWLFRERVGTKYLAGMLLALGGAGLLVGKNIETPRGFGDALALATAFFYAGYQLSVKQLRRGLSTPTIMLWSGAVATIGFLAVAAVSGEDLVPESARGWLVLVGLAIVSHLGGQTLIAYAVGHLPVGFSSIGLLSQAVVAAALGWIVLGEPLGGLQALGGALLLVGIALAKPLPEDVKP
jgi:drug/metabolite transporter (DMT)-like permease